MSKFSIRLLRRTEVNKIMNMSIIVQTSTADIRHKKDNHGGYLDKATSFHSEILRISSGETFLLSLVPKWAKRKARYNPLHRRNTGKGQIFDD